MINLDNITLSDPADIEKVNSNFQKIQPAVNNNESKITNLETTVNAHTQQINDLQENLADYIDAFDTKADLDAYSGTLSNNDWAVVLDDETHSNQCWRYIYKESTSSWLPQFMINETPLTQTQLAALNSGIDSTKVAQIAQNTNDIANKQDTLTVGDGISSLHFSRNKQVVVDYATPNDPATHTTRPYKASDTDTLLGDKISKTTDIQAIEFVTEEPLVPNPTTLYILGVKKEPLKFTSKQNGSMIYYNAGSVTSSNIDIQISTDNGNTWSSWDGSEVTLDNGESACVKNNNSTLSVDGSDYFTLGADGEVEASGDIMSLLNYATELYPYCFYALFSFASGLVKAPDLKATTLANHCYEFMFNGCTSIRYIKIYYTGNFSEQYFLAWVQSASSTGTLYYNGSDTTVGDSAIPTGWTVQTF